MLKPLKYLGFGIAFLFCFVFVVGLFSPEHVPEPIEQIHDILLGGVLSDEVEVATGTVTNPLWRVGTSPVMVWANDTDAYVFWMNSSSSLQMSSSTDSGATWSSGRQVDNVNTADVVDWAVWYDQWTSGDTGSIIHVATTDTGTDDIYYTQVDLSTGAISTTVLATTQAASCSNGVSCYVSITQAENGVLYAGSTDGSDRWVVECSTTCTTSTNWSENASAFDANGNNPVVITYIPGDNDVLLMWYDVSNQIYEYNVWDDSAGAWLGHGDLATTVDADNANTEGNNLAMVSDENNNAVYIAYITNTLTPADATADIHFYTYTTAGGFSAGTNCSTDSEGSGMVTAVKLAYDKQNDKIYCIYVRRSDYTNQATGSIYYKTSTDGGSTWSSESSAINNDANFITGLSSNFVSDERLGVSWYYDSGANPDEVWYMDIVDITAGGGGGGGGATPFIFSGQFIDD